MASLPEFIPTRNILLGDSVTATTTTSARNVKHKRRYCRVPGCQSIVKSQGLCQRHGAKPRKCKVDGCTKQAQGNFDGMCKSHFNKAHKQQATTPFVVPPKRPERDDADDDAAAARMIENNHQNQPLPSPERASVYDYVLPASVGWVPSAEHPVMPLIQHLRNGCETNKPPAWHRNEERRARGLAPIQNTNTQLEGWERELVWMEILVLSGVPGASFRHLARGWGRDKGFHMVLAQFICERRGNVERKKRDRGAPMVLGSTSTPPQPPPPPLPQPATGTTSTSVVDGVIVGANAWDGTCYTTNAYNEILASELLNLNSPQHTMMEMDGRDFCLDPDDDDDDHITDASSCDESPFNNGRYCIEGEDSSLPSSSAA